MSKQERQRWWIPRIFTSIAMVACIIAILVAGGLTVLNSQWFLHFAESRLTESLGHEVDIGAMEVDVGRISRLRVEKLWVANPSWAADPYLASVDVLEVGIDLIKLLRGDLLITDLQATAPVVHLELSGQGKANWAQGNGGNSSPDDQPTGRAQDNATLDLPRIESVTVKGGRMTYLDPRKDIFLALSFHAGRREASTGQSGLIANGGGHLGGEPVTIELSARSASLASPTQDNPIQLALHINAVQTTFHVEGEIDALLSPDTAELQVRLDGKNLSRWNEVIDTGFPAFPAYQLAGHLMLADEVWSIDDLKARVKDSDVTGTLKVYPEANPVRIEGHLASTRLDVGQLQTYVPQQQDSGPLAVKAGNFLNSIAHADWQISVTLRTDLIETGVVTVHNADIAMRLGDHMLLIESSAAEVAGTQLNVETQISVEEKLAEAQVRLRAENIGILNMARVANDLKSGTSATPGIPGNLEMNLAMNIHMIGRPEDNIGSPAGSGPHEPIHAVDLNTLDIEIFHIQYKDPSTNTHIQAQIDENISDRLILKANGEFRNEPLTLIVTAPTIESIIVSSPAGATGTHLSADLQLAGTTASLSGMIQPAWPPMWMNLSFSAMSETPATFARLFDVEFPSLGKMKVNGSLSRRSHLWSLNETSANIGESDISGQAKIDTADKWRFNAKLHSNTLNVASLMPTNGINTPTTKPAISGHEPLKDNSNQRQSRGIALPHWLTNLQGILSIQVERLVLPGATLQNVTARTTIDNGLFRITPLTIDLGGGTITTTAQLNLQEPSLAGNLQTDIQRMDLNKTMQALERDIDIAGKVSGRLALSLPPSQQNTEFLLDSEALIERLHIDEIRLRYDDPELQARTDLRLKADSFTSGIHITGTIEYRDNPIDVSLSTGSFRQALQDYGSMPVDATFIIRESTITLDGNVGDLFPVAKFKGTVGMEGPDPARLGDALGISLPHFPPYRLEALVHREQGNGSQQTVNLNNLVATIGDSDVAGSLRVSTGGERPMIFARLETRTLDLDDLAGLIGAPPDPDEAASPEQEAHAEAAEEQNTLLPDKPIDFTQLRKLDANVEYRAKEVKAPDLPLNDFVLDMVLEDGHMQMDRVDFGVGTGTVAMQLDVNAHESPVLAKLHTDFDQVNLSRLLARFEVANDSFGNIGGRALLWMRGESLADWLGSADGGLFLTMTGGTIDALLVELAGLDFTESAAVFLSNDTGVKIECAYTDLQARSGMVTIHPFLFDTTDTKFTGHGTIDLRQEKMNLTVEPYPKDFTILSSRGPLHVSGTFMKPSFNVDPTFPSPEFGTADDSARCSGMVDALRTARKTESEPAK